MGRREVFRVEGSSEVGLVGPPVYWLQRKPAELQGGPENSDERKLLKLPTSALER